MSWGTDFKADIYLSRQAFHNIYELEGKIKDNEKIIESVKQRLMMYASASPSELVPEDWEEDSVNFLAQRIEELLEELEDLTIENYKLNLYLETDPFNKVEDDK